ncbi:trypsin-like peptidase domain-containing protein [Kribbella sp. C-35]|uniref:trypsin-like peptidase domain-containing protein n=1 Tax=Kribbella sp. C-35 TaxID=2789276 RepID=UPI00397B729A
MELRVSAAGGAARVGSGYLIDRGWILTAGHVVRGMDSVRAWVDPEAELTADCESAVDASAIQYVGRDWALLPIGTEPPPGFVPAVFARVDRERGEPISAVALGLPWFKLREPAVERGTAEAAARPLIREVAAVAGDLMPLSNVRTGTLAMDVRGGPDAATHAQGTRAGGADRVRSVWEGMSGSAVWAGAELVGIVIQHHPVEGATTLTVAGVPGPQVPDATQIGSVGGGRAIANLVRPTVLTSVPDAVAARYRRSAERLAPPILSGRSEELAELDAFAAGSERWRWYSAGAFGGKTALLAWWTAHQQLRDTVVVGTFLRRSAGMNTARDVITSLSTQLAAVAGLSDFEIRQLQAQVIDATSLTRLEDLLEDAARQCRRLVVVVDGLDEHEPLGQIPLAEWLPGPRSLILPANAALVVSSRAGAPAGLPDGHPLYDHKVLLHPSTVAGKVRQRAEQEISHALQDPGRLDARIIGFLAAASGPLTHADLKALIQALNLQVLESDIQLVWNRHLSRTLVPDAVGNGYEFSHDALREHARASFAGDLPAYRAGIDAWADRYAARAWPSDTPRYLLMGYANMLAAEGEKGRLAAIATDTDRQARLRTETGGDSIGLSELTTAADLLSGRGSPSATGKLDLHQLARVVWHRDQLRHRNDTTPSQLPVVWARLGQYGRAQNLAASITDRGRRAESLVLVAIEEARAGLSVEAAAVIEGVEQALDTITDPDERDNVRADAVISMANAGMHLDAQRISGSISSSHHRSRAVAARAAALAVTGDRREAARLVREFVDVGRGSREWFMPGDAEPVALALALAMEPAEFAEVAELVSEASDRGSVDVLATFLGLAGRAEQAKRLLAGSPGVTTAGRDLLAMAVIVGRTLDPERALAVAGEIQRGTVAILPPWWSEDAAVSLVGALVAGGRADVAERMVNAIADPNLRSQARSALVEFLVRARRPADAVRIGRQYRSLTDHIMLMAAMAADHAQQGRFAESSAVVRDAERIVAGAGDEEDEDERSGVLAKLAIAVGVAGHPSEPGQIVRNIARASLRDEAVVTVADALIETGAYDAAHSLITSIADPALRAGALTTLAAATADAGSMSRAAALAEEAEHVAATFTDPERHTRELALLAAALWRSGQGTTATAVADQASRLVTMIASPEKRSDALRAVTAAFGRAGQPSAAQDVALTVRDAQKQAEALFAASRAFAEAGDHRQARIAAREAGFGGLHQHRL